MNTETKNIDYKELGYDSEQSYWLDMFNKNGIDTIPEEHITQEMANIHFNKYKTISLIPKNFITQEMIEEYWNNDVHFKFIPNKFKTQEMVNKYWNKYKTLYSIPHDLMNKEMVDEYFDRTFDIKPIPPNFITDDIIIKVICNVGISKAIDEYFNSKKINEDYIYQLYKDNQDYIIKNSKFIKDTQQYWEKYGKEVLIYIGIEYIPEEYLTQELCNMHVSLKNNVSNIPTHFIDENIIISLICKNGICKTIEILKNKVDEFSIGLIYQNSQSYIMENSTLYGDKTYWDIYAEDVCHSVGLYHVPEEYITKDMCYFEFIKSEPKSVLMIPEKFIDDNIIMTLINEIGLENAIEDCLGKVDEDRILEIYSNMNKDNVEENENETKEKGDEDNMEQQYNNELGLENLNNIIPDKEFYLSIIKNKNINFEPEIIKYIPSDILDKEICLEAIKRDASSFKIIPKSIANDEFEKEAVKLNGLIIKHFNKNNITKEIVKEAVKSNPKALKYVNRKLIDNETVQFVVNDYNALKYIPENLINEEVAFEIIKNGKDSISFIPNNILNFKICLEAAKIDPTSIQYMPASCANILLTIYSIN